MSYYCEDVLNVIWPNIRNALFISDLDHTDCIGIIYSKKGNFKSWSMYNGTLIQLIVHMTGSLLCFKMHLLELTKTSGNNDYFVPVFELQENIFGKIEVVI